MCADIASVGVGWVVGLLVDLKGLDRREPDAEVSTVFSVQPEWISFARVIVGMFCVSRLLFQYHLDRKSVV